MQLSDVQAFASLQTLPVPAQTPAVHTSLLVQALPSLHVPPLAMLVKTQLPVLTSQVSVVQALLSLQVLAVPPHLPVVQVSGLVQALPSLQVVPSVALANKQLPVPVSHESLVQPLPSLQTLAVPPQLPAVQMSLAVQALPSLQALPSASPMFLQLPVVGAQLSDVQALLSLQFLAVPAQRPALHASPAVQASPSLHELPSATAA